MGSFVTEGLTSVSNSTLTSFIAICGIGTIVRKGTFICILLSSSDLKDIVADLFSSVLISTDNPTVRAKSIDACADLFWACTTALSGAPMMLSKGIPCKSEEKLSFAILEGICKRINVPQK